MIALLPARQTVPDDLGEIVLFLSEIKSNQIWNICIIAVRCRYNAIQYIMLLYAALWWLMQMQNINQTFISQKPIHISRLHG